MYYIYFLSLIDIQLFILDVHMFYTGHLEDIPLYGRKYTLYKYKSNWPIYERHAWTFCSKVPLASTHILSLIWLSPNTLIVTWQEYCRYVEQQKTINQSRNARIFAVCFALEMSLHVPILRELPLPVTKS